MHQANLFASHSICGYLNHIKAKILNVPGFWLDPFRFGSGIIYARLNLNLYMGMAGQKEKGEAGRLRRMLWYIRALLYLCYAQGKE